MFRLTNIFQKKLIKDYSLTFFFSGAGALINFVIIKIIFNNYGDDSFFQYSYLRRILSFALPVVLLGLGVSLAKSVSKDYDDTRRHSSLVLSALGWISLIPLLFLFMTITFPEDLSFLIWGETSDYYIELNWYFLMYIVGLALMSINYAHYRGKLRMMPANLIEFSAQSLVPLLCYTIMGTFPEALKLVGISLILINAIILIYYFIKFPPVLPDINMLSKELLSFGLPRLPGDFAFYFLLLTPSFLAIHMFSLELSGIISFSIMLTSVVMIALQPVGVLSLSRAVNLIHRKKMNVLKKETMATLKIMTLYALGATIGLQALIPFFIEWFFDATFLDYLTTIRIMLVITPFMGVFYTLRGVIDAYYHKPVVGNISLITIGYFAIISTVVFYFDMGFETFLFGFVSSTVLLSMLCYIQLRKFL